MRLARAVDIIQHRLTGIFQLMTALGSGSQPPNRPASKRPEMIGMADLFEPDRERLRIEPRAAAKLLWGLTLAANHPALADGHPATSDEIVSFLLDGIRSPDSPR